MLSFPLNCRTRAKENNVSQGYIIIGERGVGLLLPVARSPIIVSRSSVGFKEGRLDLEQEGGKCIKLPSS